MANLYQYKGKMVTADRLRELRAADSVETVEKPVKKVKKAEEPKVEEPKAEEPKVEVKDIANVLEVSLADKYKELHPENKDVPNNKKNDKAWIQNKIEEFTNN